MQTQAAETSVPLADVIRRCRAIAGHSRPHVLAMLRRMEKLNLVTIEAASAEHAGGMADYGSSTDGRQVVTFDAARVVDRAQQVADHDLDLSINSELELIELADLEALIGVDRKLLLNKLSHGEIADELFAFRKSKVLGYVEQKGVAYFSRRHPRAGDVQSLEDVVWVDQRTLFDVISGFDTYDLAKLIASLDDRAIADKLFSVMTEARRNEVSWVMRRELKLDPLEVGEIERRVVEAVRAARRRPPALRRRRSRRPTRDARPDGDDMDLLTLAGVLLGGAAIVFGFALEGGHFSMLFQFEALVIVLGGTLGAVMIQNTWARFSMRSSSCGSRSCARRKWTASI
jgi:hypothetical protein